MVLTERTKMFLLNYCMYGSDSQAQESCFYQLFTLRVCIMFLQALQSYGGSQNVCVILSDSICQYSYCSYSFADI